MVTPFACKNTTFAANGQKNKRLFVLFQRRGRCRTNCGTYALSVGEVDIAAIVADVSHCGHFFYYSGKHVLFF